MDFGRLVGGFRRQLFEEVAASDLPGLIFTYVWAFDLPGDAEALEGYAAPFRERNARIFYLELSASQEVRLQRNQGEFRLAEKPSKRDLERSTRNLLELEETYRLNSTDEFADRSDYLRVDNTAATPEEVAEQAVKRFGLVRH